MARKTYEEAEPEAPADAEPAGRLDRDLHRTQMTDLKELANRLAKMPAKFRRTLPLDDELQSHLDQLANADLRPDRRRLLMRTKLLLSAVDLVLLDAALQGNTPTTARNQESVLWRTRLIAGDDRDLQAFMEANPHADRQSIRANAREARGTTPAAARAQARLLQLLRRGPTEE